MFMKYGKSSRATFNVVACQMWHATTLKVPRVGHPWCTQTLKGIQQSILCVLNYVKNENSRQRGQVVKAPCS